jgi:hypothetical protein
MQDNNWFNILDTRFSKLSSELIRNIITNDTEENIFIRWQMEQLLMIAVQSLQLHDKEFQDKINLFLKDQRLPSLSSKDTLKLFDCFPKVYQLVLEKQASYQLYQAQMQGLLTSSKNPTVVSENGFFHSQGSTGSASAIIAPLAATKIIDCALLDEARWQPIDELLALMLNEEERKTATQETIGEREENFRQKTFDLFNDYFDNSLTIDTLRFQKLSMTIQQYRAIQPLHHPLRKLATCLTAITDSLVESEAFKVIFNIAKHLIINDAILFENDYQADDISIIKDIIQNIQKLKNTAAENIVNTLQIYVKHALPLSKKTISNKNLTDFIDTVKKSQNSISTISSMLINAHRNKGITDEIQKNLLGPLDDYHETLFIQKNSYDILCSFMAIVISMAKLMHNQEIFIDQKVETPEPILSIHNDSYQLLQKNLVSDRDKESPQNDSVENTTTEKTTILASNSFLNTKESINLESTQIMPVDQKNNDIACILLNKNQLKKINDVRDNFMSSEKKSKYLKAKTLREETFKILKSYHASSLIRNIETLKKFNLEKQKNHLNSLRTVLEALNQNLREINNYFIQTEFSAQLKKATEIIIDKRLLQQNNYNDNDIRLLHGIFTKIKTLKNEEPIKISIELRDYLQELSSSNQIGSLNDKSLKKFINRILNKLVKPSKISEKLQEEDYQHNAEIKELLSTLDEDNERLITQENMYGTLDSFIRIQQSIPVPVKKNEKTLRISRR